MRQATKIAAVAGAVVLLAAGCGKPSTSSSSGGGGGSSAKAFKACMVLDTGGVDDHSFNQSSWAGMQAAAKANPNIHVSFVSSNSGNDYTPNLTNETNASPPCNTIIAVGGLMATNVAQIAKANPSQHYAEIDAPSAGKNDYGLQYNTAQGAFLGGYLAAGMSKSGVVGTYGGLAIPPVTIYMDGFWEGVQYYNKVNHKSVKVLGWNEHQQHGGVFIGGQTAFNNLSKGQSITQQFEQQGADIVFPVAGGSGLGSGAAAASSGGHLKVIWVDTDGCVSVPQYCKYFLTSVTKGLTTSTTKYVEQAAAGHFPTGNYVGTLANGGTALAPFHDFSNKVPSSLKSQLNKVKADIISGKIKITSPSQPKG